MKTRRAGEEGAAVAAVDARGGGAPAATAARSASRLERKRRSSDPSDLKWSVTIMNSLNETYNLRQQRMSLRDDYTA